MQLCPNKNLHLILHRPTFIRVLPVATLITAVLPLRLLPAHLILTPLLELLIHQNVLLIILHETLVHLHHPSHQLYRSTGLRALHLFRALQFLGVTVVGLSSTRCEIVLSVSSASCAATASALMNHRRCHTTKTLLPLIVLTIHLHEYTFLFLPNIHHQQMNIIRIFVTEVVSAPDRPQPNY